MKRFLVVLAATLSLGLAPARAAPQKVLRVPFIIAETNFDPAFVSDQYSHNVVAEIFEPPLTYDFLARPMKLKPQTAEAMPEITDGGRTYTIRLKKGVYFADDPAFGAAKRELTAADYEFAMKRLMDPKIASPNLWLIEGRVAGVDEMVAKAKKDGRLDYDARVPGIEVVDRYTLRVRLVKPDYNFLYILAMANIGAMLRPGGFFLSNTVMPESGVPMLRLAGSRETPYWLVQPSSDGTPGTFGDRVFWYQRSR